jgi:CubicO group peptidase (beta-lactamase class C family)
MQESMSTTDQPMESRFDELRAWFETRMKELGIPGAALGVVRGDFTQALGLGVADQTTGIPVTTSTAFRVASLTKILTASALVAVANKTGLRIDAPIATWYPGFRLADTGVPAAVTIEQLLSHSAGWADTPWPESDAANLTLADVVDDVASSVQLCAPGQLFNYSNSSFLLAGHILATTTGITYEEAITKLLLQPLTMTNSGFSPVDVSQVVVAPGHTAEDTGMKPITRWEHHAAVNPAAGLLSTVDDLLRFVSFQSGTMPAEMVPLSDAQRLTMQEPHGPGGSLGPTIADAIGLGWMLTNVGRHRVAMSFGSDTGAAAGMAIVTDAGFGVVVLANAELGLLLATETVRRAIDIFLGANSVPLTPSALTADDLNALEGTYEIPGDLTFEVSVDEDEVQITASADDQMVSDISGPVTMISPVIGSLTVNGMPILIDFVRDGVGPIGWIRSFARLAPRTH